MAKTIIKKKKSKGLRKLPPKIVKDKVRKFDVKKYLSISSNESVEKFEQFGKKVQNKQLKWAFYIIENSVGVHYYLIL